MARFLPNSFTLSASAWLRQGMSPRRLALTLALGFAVGCIPVIGIPTLLCAALALALRLNLPAIQAANYAAMPFQLVLMVPFVRLGQRLFCYLPRHGLTTAMLAPGSPHMGMWGTGLHMGWLAGQALFAWMLVAGPAVMLMTLSLTLMLRRIPALNSAQAGD